MSDCEDCLYLVHRAGFPSGSLCYACDLKAQLAAAQAEVKRLVGIYERDMERMDGEYKGLNSELARLRAQIDRQTSAIAAQQDWLGECRKALEYYACRDHYEERKTLSGLRPPGVLVEGGKKARALLARMDNGEGSTK